MPGRTLAELEALLGAEGEARRRAEAALAEARAEQAATADVLGAISRSPAEAQSVLDTIAASALRLTRSHRAWIYQVEGDSLRTLAIAHSRPLPPEQPDRSHVAELLRDRGFATARASIERRTVQVSDVLAAADELPVSARLARRSGDRARLIVPLRRGGAAIGVLAVLMDEPRTYSAQEVALLESFADQAVIAIENARLFSELQQRTAQLSRSVDRLTALFEVGQAVGGTLDLQRVLDTVVARASDLAGADGGAVYEYDPAVEAFELRASYRMPEELVAAVRGTPIRLGETVVGRAGAERAPVQYADVLAEEADGRTRAALERAGYRAVLAVPLLRESAVVGTLVSRRLLTQQR